MAVIKALFSVIAIAVLSASLIVFIPGIPPDFSENLEAFTVKPPIKVEGWFATNNILDEAELYYESPVGDIESLAVVSDNEIYTGDSSGALLKITGKQVAETVARLQFPCEVNPNMKAGEGRNQPKCGWPLGMKFDKDGSLLTVDFFGGLTRVNVKTGKYENLIPKSQPILGKIGYTPEDLDIDKDGIVYWSDGGTSGDIYTEMLTQPTGRLIRYDPAKRKNEVLLDNIYFSNGVCLSDDGQFVIVAEFGSAKITKYYVKGAKKGQSETFVDGLPGYPDNIRPNGRGGFYVPMIAPWNDQFSLRTDLLSSRPLLRKLILRSRHIVLSFVNFVSSYLPGNVYLKEIENYIKQNGPVHNWSSIPKVASVVELSKSGEIIGIMNGKSGKISRLSQISVGDKYAFLVSPFEGKIWRIKLDILRRMK